MNAKYLGSAALVLFAVFAYFARSIGDGLQLSIAAVLVWLIPGYTLLHVLTDLDELEKVVLGFFLGFGLTPLVLYWLNVLGIPSITPVFGYGVGVLCLGVLVFTKFKRGPQPKNPDVPGQANIHSSPPAH